MDIDNDIDILETSKRGLEQTKAQFGDVNLYLITMINNAAKILEGNRFDLAKETTIQSTNNIKNVIANIESEIRFIEKLEDALALYLSNKFTEV